MSEYKRIRRETAEQHVKENIARYCRGCSEHQREHGDCVDAGTPEAMECPRIQQMIERMVEERHGICTHSWNRARECGSFEEKEARA